MYAITTQFYGPTNYRPYRIKVSGGGKAIFVTYPDVGPVEQAHRVALRDF